MNKLSSYSTEKTFFLAKTLFLSELKSHHRESFLGYTWTIAPALFLTFSFFLASEANVLNTKNLPLPYPVFAFSGVIFWQLFSDTITSFAQVMTKSKGLMLKVKINTDSILLSKIFQLLFDFIIKLGALFIIMLIYKIPFYRTLLFLPAGIFLVLILGLCIALVLSPFVILVQDLNRILPNILNFGMFLTPIFYATPPAGGLSKLVQLNPMNYLVNFNRGIIVGNIEISNTVLAIALILVCLLPLCYRFQKISTPVVIERLGN